MSTFSDFLEGALLKHAFNIATFTPGANALHVSLYTTTKPNDDGTGGVEVTGGAYARVNVPDVNWTYTEPSPSQVANNALIQFPQATASWGLVQFFGLMDAITAGNGYGWGDLTQAKTIDNGDQGEFAINALTVTLD